MTEHQILEGIRFVLRTHLHIHSPVGPETNLFRELALDSLKQLTFVVELENRFRICFDQGEEEGLTTIGDVVGLIARHLDGEDREGARLDV